MLAPTLFGASFPDGPAALLRGAAAVGLGGRRTRVAAAAVAALGRVHGALVRRNGLRLTRGPCGARAGHRVNPP